ncbi:hypothetical protein ACQJBY_070192 [Aegilops geniculata]
MAATAADPQLAAPAPPAGAGSVQHLKPPATSPSGLPSLLPAMADLAPASPLHLPPPTGQIPLPGVEVEDGEFAAPSPPAGLVSGDALLQPVVVVGDEPTLQSPPPVSSCSGDVVEELTQQPPPPVAQEPKVGAAPQPSDLSAHGTGNVCSTEHASQSPTAAVEGSCHGVARVSSSCPALLPGRRRGLQRRRRRQRGRRRVVGKRRREARGAGAVAAAELQGEPDRVRGRSAGGRHVGPARLVVPGASIR